MTAISQLYPAALWQWFDTICSIPHPSKHEDKLKSHIKAWADDRQIDYIEDTVGNLILRKPASKGMENVKPVVIQAHLDMVPQKNADKQHDFVTDPIEAYIDGDWVKAKGTTLGSDNGIGMSSALAVLGSTDIAHGPLEVLLTIDEEAGMTGAFGLEAGVLNAEILINTDSEQEGEVYMGCAGGVDASIVLPTDAETPSPKGKAFRLSVRGLKGGHSGCDIHLGRGNANKLLARFVYANHQAIDLQVASINGGSLRNAIPREGQIEIVVNEGQVAELQQRVVQFQQDIQSELCLVEPSIEWQLDAIDLPKTVFSKPQQDKIIALMHACPNGVMRMSDAIENVVETSLNMGVVSTESGQVKVLCLIRSLDNVGRDNVANMLSALAQLADADCTFSGAYPGWKPDNDSAVMKIVRDVYDDLYGNKPNIMVIHAGLECGLFKEPYPEMDMVSIGPTIRFPHSPDEKVNIKTVGQYWTLLLALLKNIPEREVS